MRYFYMLWIFVLSVSCNSEKKSDKVINGIMIDCSRLLEQHEYYFRIIDFMADWNINTLLLHFSDDHGIAISLPGFEKLAKPKAFTPKDIQRLIAHAKAKGIEIIPELEVFGHTRYITDHPDYEHLYVGEKSDKVSFNAINPLEPQTISVMESMIEEVAVLFPSKYIHLGCDEVNLESLSKSRGLDEAAVWTDYVNKMISIAHDNGKTPIIWNDHVQKNEKIARELSKDVVLMEWNYYPDYKPTKLNTLLEMGYKDIIMAPSISCYLLRVLPAKNGLTNTDAMAKSVRDKTTKGLINTIWLPMRYLQNAMWYGIAYSGYLINSEKEMNLKYFHAKFAEKVFDTPLTADLDFYLTNWTNLHLDYKIYSSISNGELDFSSYPEKMKSLEEINDLSKKLLDHQINYSPRRNKEILESMLLAARVVFVLSEGLLIFSDKSISPERKPALRRELKNVIHAVDEEWDKGRYADDPAKYKAKFPNQENSHLLIILKKINNALNERTQVHE